MGLYSIHLLNLPLLFMAFSCKSRPTTVSVTQNEKSQTIVPIAETQSKYDILVLGDNQAGAKQIDKLVYLNRTHHVLLKIEQNVVKVEVYGINETAKTPEERWILEDNYETPIL